MANDPEVSIRMLLTRCQDYKLAVDHVAFSVYDIYDILKEGVEDNRPENLSACLVMLDHLTQGQIDRVLVEASELAEMAQQLSEQT